MRYLRKFNEEVESIDNIVSDIKDMSLYIIDEYPNYTIDVYSNTKDINWKQARLCIDIFYHEHSEEYSEDNMLILNDEVFDFLERVDKYLIDKGFNPSIICYSDVDNEHGVESESHYTKFKNMKSLINKIGGDIDIDSIRLVYIPLR